MLGGRRQAAGFGMSLCLVARPRSSFTSFLCLESHKLVEIEFAKEGKKKPLRSLHNGS